MKASKELMESIADRLRQVFPSGDPMFTDYMVRAMELHSRKNQDYARGGNPLGNFMRVSQIINIYPGIEKIVDKSYGVALFYMLKQFDASMYMMANDYEGDVEDVNARLFDVMVYTCLIMIMRDREKEYNLQHASECMSSTDPGNPLHSILEESIKELEQTLEDCGDCDHSVSVCVCGLKDLIARGKTLLYGADPDPEGLYL